MNKYCEHYWKIEKYKQNYEKMINHLRQTDDFNEKLTLAIYIANYFVYHNTGYYTSSVLEEFFVDFAKSIKVDLSDIKYKENTVLHILTEGLETGGHTRVIERWIENAPNNQVHSVVQTRTTNAELTTLSNNVKAKNGEFISLDNELSFEERAIQLRKIAMKYEYVILHTHMDDPIPLIAFGTEDFTRPILFYNHASHMPWLGKSIADLVLDIENNDPVTKVKRGIKDTYFLGVPSKEISISISDKKEIRKKIDLPVNKKIIITCGNDSKYRTISGKSFADYLIDIMDDNTSCYAIGIEQQNEEWKKSIEKSGMDIKLLGYISFSEKFLDYLKAADLYLDSYPFCGGTATIDAISSGTPILSLKSVYPQFDYLTKTSAYCKTEEEFIDKAKKVLSDENYAKELFKELKTSLIKYQSIDVWNEKVKKLYEIAPKKHKVKDLSDIKDYSEPNDLSVLCNVLVNKNFVKLKHINSLSVNEIDEVAKYGVLYKKHRIIPFIFKIFSHRKLNTKTKVFKLFGKTIYVYSKKEL